MHTNIQTIAVISVFAIFYLFYTVMQTSRQKLDIYDLVMLSTVAVIPWFFAIFPNAAEFLSHLSGVAFPFVIMFGALFAVIFIFIHRITVKVHSLERDNRLLIQEISLLKEIVSRSSSGLDVR